MTDYTELVKALRNHASKESDCRSCKYYYYNIVKYDTCSSSLCAAAASAIEELQETLEAVQKNSGINFRMWEEAQAEVEWLQAELPKRGEVVRCGECKWHAPLDRKRPFFCPVMDCATGVMGNDFCSRGERRAKMEVQDD